MALHRVAEDPLADHHGQHGGVQRDDLAGPVHQHVPVLGRELGRAGIPLARPARPEPLPPDPAEDRVAGDRRARAEPLPDVLMDHAFPGAHAHLRPAQGLLANREDRFPDLLGDAGMAAAFPQPAFVRAADQPEPAPGVLPPDQGPVADRVQAQHPGVLGIKRLQLRNLGPAAAGQRRGGRVVLRLRLSRPGLQRVPAAESRRDLQQVRHPQLGQLPPARLQVTRQLGLAAPVGPRGGGPRRRPKVRVTGQEPQADLLAGAVPADQVNPAKVGLTALDRPLPPVQHHRHAGRQLPQRTGPHHAAPGTSSERSAKGPARSIPTCRCQIRCSS